jgi:hypothetical protein
MGKGVTSCTGLTRRVVQERMFYWDQVVPSPGGQAEGKEAAQLYWQLARTLEEALPGQQSSSVTGREGLGPPVITWNQLQN